MTDKLPPKPRCGSPCNGCGACCAQALCHIGRAVFGDDGPLPCPALCYRDGRDWCAFVLAESAAEFEPVIAKSLGIGEGCQMSDDNLAPGALAA